MKKAIIVSSIVAVVGTASYFILNHFKKKKASIVQLLAVVRARYPQLDQKYGSAPLMDAFGKMDDQGRINVYNLVSDPKTTVSDFNVMLNQYGLTL